METTRRGGTLQAHHSSAGTFNVAQD